MVTGDKKDVSFAHDLIFFLQSCVSAEHHAISSYVGTKEEIFLQIADKIRRVRSKIMYKYIKESKAQIYCLSKHLMQMAQSQKEIGNRYTEEGEKNLAKECFEESADWEALFLILNDFYKEGNYKESNFFDKVKNKINELKGGKDVQPTIQETSSEEY